MPFFKFGLAEGNAPSLMAGFYSSITQFACVHSYCCRLALFWAAFASQGFSTSPRLACRGALSDERQVTLLRLAKFSECDTIGGHLILHRADMLSPTQSLYLLVCLSSFAEPPLVGLTFGLRSGLAPLLRSRRSDVRRLAPSATYTISDTLTEPTQT